MPTPGTTLYPDAAQVSAISTDTRRACLLDGFEFPAWLVSVGLRVRLDTTDDGVAARLVPLFAGPVIAWRKPEGGFHDPAFSASTSAEALRLIAEAVVATDIYYCAGRSILLRKGYYRNP